MCTQEKLLLIPSIKKSSKKHLLSLHLKKNKAFYLGASTLLSILLLNSFLIDLDVIKNKLGFFVLAQDENSKTPIALLEGSRFVFFITQENSLLPTNQILSQEEVITDRINVVVTAYSSQEWQTDDTPFITASGTYVRDGIIASNLLPFGTKVRIPELFGQKIFVVEDRLHARKGLYHIDIWFPSLKEALAFGTKYTYLEILR